MSFLIKQSQKKDLKVQLKKKYRLNFMKIRIFASQKTLLKEGMKRQATDWGK